MSRQNKNSLQIELMVHAVNQILRSVLKLAPIAGLALLSSVGTFAQTAATTQQALDFANTLAPQNTKQIANPSALPGGGTVPSSMPSGLGMFSSPSTTFDQFQKAKASGLTFMGQQAQRNCASYSQGTDPSKDEECQAINVLTTRCMYPSNSQQAVLGNYGQNQGSAANCEGTYGANAQNSGYAEQISANDSMFRQTSKSALTTQLKNMDVCTPQTVETSPAQYETQVCIQSQDTSIQSCSQYTNITVETTTTSATKTNFCPQGIRSGDYCQYDSTGAAKQELVCPFGFNLSGTSCTKTTTTSATPIYSCPSGAVLTGSTCSTSTSSSTAANIASYSCPAGASLSGSNCLTTSTQVATIASYACSSGQNLIGSTCNSTSNSILPATTTYSCPTDYSKSGSLCTYTNTTAATPNFTCPKGYTTNYHNCSMATTVAANATYSCPAETVQTSPSTCMLSYLSNGWCPALSVPFLYQYDLQPGGADQTVCVYGSQTNYSCPIGQTLSGATCNGTVTTTATIGSYTCPTGSTLSGSSCLTTISSTATITYSCPPGQNLSGSTCTQTITTSNPATPIYGCQSDFNLSGTTCTKTITTSASPVYSCPSGSILNGSTCSTNTTSSTSANIVSYSCPIDTVLSGSICETTVSQNPSIIYSCPSGSTLSGSTCSSTITIPMTIQYSCVDGSAAVNGYCIFKSSKLSWVSTCTAYENSAGQLLGTP